MTFEEAERWLDGLINRERQPRVSYSRFGLEAIEALLARLDNPERSLPVVHLAGSKGKGSTALFIEALLLELGESVGTFTSPHLERWTERFRLNGREVTGAALASVVQDIRPHVDAMRQVDASLWPSFFDATTAAAFELFQRANVDRAVIEVGLGGRLDSTNVVTPGVTCVTSIEFEHTDKLGDSLAEIAGEKAAILKHGVPCVMGRLPSEAAKVVEEKAAGLPVPLMRLGEDFDVEALAHSSSQIRTPLRFRFGDGFSFDARLAVPGAHQQDNAALAVAAVRALRSPSDPSRSDHLRSQRTHSDTRIAAAAQRAFASIQLPGRVEVVERNPWVVIDGAHTRESVRALAVWLAEIPVRRRHFVLSLALDKALDPILDLLLTLADELTLTRAEPIRALDPAEVAARVAERGGNVKTRVIEDPEEAVRSARAALSDDSLLCVVGSVYLAGIGRRVLVQR